MCDDGVREAKRCRSSTCPLKPLVLQFCQRRRYIGCIPSRLHTDARTMFDCLRLSKPIRLSAERVQAVEQALTVACAYHQGSVIGEGTGDDVTIATGARGPPFPTFAALELQINAWREKQFASQNWAETHYDAPRARAYTESNRVPQRNMTVAAALMCHDTFSARKYPLTCDIGCGSGLSAMAVRSLGASFILGFDISSSMLREAIAATRTPHSQSTKHSTLSKSCALMDFVQADMGQPLPLRAGVLDNCISIGALQYLSSERQGSSAHQRITRCFQSLYACLRLDAPAVFQLFPETLDDMVKFQCVAREGGLFATAVVDHPHETESAQWFLHCRKNKDETPPVDECVLLHPLHAACPWSLLRCGQTSLPVSSHLDWVIRRHAKESRRLLRCHARQQLVLSAGEETSGWTKKKQPPRRHRGDAVVEKSYIAIDGESEKNGILLTAEETTTAVSLLQHFSPTTTVAEMMADIDTLYRLLHRQTNIV